MNKLERGRQFRHFAMSAATEMPNAQAAKFPTLYQEWAVGETVVAGDRRYYPPTEKLYVVNEGMGHTTQADWTPDVTPALWSVVDVEHAGTTDDPITASRGMVYVYGKYYIDPEDGLLYLCERQNEAVGNEVVLQYLPHELVGNYFTLVATEGW